MFIPLPYEVALHSNARSHSSLSTFPVKSRIFSKIPAEISLEVTQLYKNKHELEEKILWAMQEIKTLKPIQKSFKDKEVQFEALQQVLGKSIKDLIKIRQKSEYSEKIVKEISSCLENNNDEALGEVLGRVGSYKYRFQEKRKSLAIEDLDSRCDLKNNAKTTRELKMSPYFSYSSMRLIKTSKGEKVVLVNKPQSFALAKRPAKDRLEQLFKRIRRTFVLISNQH